MARNSERERRFGMEPGDIEWLDTGKCWICHQPETIPNRSLAIDHDHNTGAIRGFLCARCNNVIGRMQDNPDLLRSAANYLDRASKQFSDGCEPCVEANRVDTWLNAPAAILERDEFGTVFGYRCACGHRWTCWHRTVGVPTAWQL